VKFLRAGHDPSDAIGDVEFVSRDLTELGLRMEVPQGWGSFFASIENREPSFVLETTTMTTPQLMVIVVCSLDWTARTHTQLKHTAQRVMRQMHLSHNTKSSIRRTQYGPLSGYESTYECGAFSQRLKRNIPMQERLFYGHRLGKPLVVLQATTEPGGLSRWDPMVRHLWNSVRYLSAAAVTAAIRAQPAARKMRAKRLGSR
jgi:hypothetical protein